MMEPFWRWRINGFVGSVGPGCATSARPTMCFMIWNICSLPMPVIYDFSDAEQTLRHPYNAPYLSPLLGGQYQKFCRGAPIGSERDFRSMRNSIEMKWNQEPSQTDKTS